jgi:hypothetical protein
MEEAPRDIRKQLSLALDGLGRALGLELELNEDGVCMLAFGEDLELAIQSIDDGRIVIGALLMSELDALPEGFFEALLEYHLLGVRTGGGALAWNAETRGVVLWENHPSTFVTSDSLNAHLEGFIERALRVRAEISELLGA